MVSVVDSESSLRHLTRRTGLHFGRILGEQRRSAKKKRLYVYHCTNCAAKNSVKKARSAGYKTLDAQLVNGTGKFGGTLAMH